MYWDSISNFLWSEIDGSQISLSAASKSNVAHVFSMLSRDDKFHKDLFEFLKDSEVKRNLKKYKLQRLNSYHIKYFIENKMIRFCPKLFLKMLNKLRA